MALNSTDFVPKGPIRSADIQQFVNLFTGVMTDQPVNFANALTIGGSQGQNTSPLKIYGATGQTSDLIDLYTDHTNLNPSFGFAASGRFAWGAGGTTVQDTWLYRAGDPQGNVASHAGLVADPYLGVRGNLQLSGSLQFMTDASLATIRYSMGPNAGGTFQMQPGLQLGATAPAGPFLSPYLVSSTPPLGTGAGNTQMPLTLYSALSNQGAFNFRWIRQAAGSDWGTAGMQLAYDVDGSQGAGGWLSFMGGKVCIGGWPTNAETFQVNGSLGVASTLNMRNNQITAVNQLNFNSGAYMYGNSDRVEVNNHMDVAFDLQVGRNQITAGTLQVNGVVNTGSSITAAGGIQAGGSLNAVNGNLYLNTRRMYDGGNGLHVDWDFRLDAQHDLFTHTVHLQQSSGEDCRIDTVGDMNYWGPNGSTNHRFHHTDGSWMGCQAANFSSQSARAGKENIAPLASNKVLEVLCDAAVRGVSFDREDGTPDIGFIADDWLAHFPEIVGRNRDSGEVETLEYSRITAILWEAVRLLVQRNGLCP